MIIRYRDPAERHNLDIYKFELIHRVMELTRKEFGDYQAIPYRGSDTGQQRWAHLINEGKLINIAWVSPGTAVANANVIPIPVDIMHGLLGFRVCLINKDAPNKFNEVLKLNALDSLKIGQALTWDDIAIYHHNNINPILSPNFSSLFDMLGSRRFDCIALGINEIFLIQQEKKSRYPFLVIEEKLLIYYEFPTYLYVSKTEPRLAMRLQLGLEKMQQNGDLVKLFKEYHPYDFTSLHLDSRKAICLKSPFVDALKPQCVKSLSFPLFH
ncbi:MAG: hypothetical protein V4732_20700 [Pseudomonadota bacterium]